MNVGKLHASGLLALRQFGEWLAHDEQNVVYGVVLFFIAVVTGGAE